MIDALYNNFKQTVFLFSALLLMMALGLLNFELWDQVEYVRQSSPEITLRGIYTEWHKLRYLLVYPVYEASYFFEIGQGFVFGVYLILIISIASFVISSVVDVFGNVDFIYKLLIPLLLFFLSFFMNGRLVFGILGCGLVLLSALFLIRNSYFVSSFLCFFGFVFSSVSSGVFISLYFIYMSIFFICAVYYRFFLGRSFAVGYLFILIVFYVFFPIFLMMFIKNYFYFGGGAEAAVNALDHGLMAEDNSGMNLQLLFKVFLFCFLAFLVFFVVVLRRFISNGRALYVTFYFCSVLLFLSMFANSILVIAFVPFSVLGVLASSMLVPAVLHGRLQIGKLMK
ncbi:hypothetical protein [uncultured Amphritea sp.]|uniref:hypothetical protein n=1 Tax=uncultured Amphritea sp. TaxID=981605 RepID=UPI00261BDC72|nr:hypothetical protein [uncultured Amphritea sp.]